MPASLEVSHKANYAEADIGLAVAAFMDSGRALSGLTSFTGEQIMEMLKAEGNKTVTGLLDATIAPTARFCI